MLSKKGFTLVELTIAIAVMGIATALAVLFSVSTSNNVKNEKLRSERLYQVKDVHDYTLGWLSSYDTAEYEWESVESQCITVRKIATDDTFVLRFENGCLYLEEVIIEVPLVDNVVFAQKDNAVKVTVYYGDYENSFIVYRKTN